MPHVPENLRNDFKKWLERNKPNHSDSTYRLTQDREAYSYAPESVWNEYLLRPFPHYGEVSYLKKPAVSSRSELYLIYQNRVVGKVGITVSHSTTVEVSPIDEGTEKFFRENGGFSEEGWSRPWYLKNSGFAYDYFTEGYEFTKYTRVVDVFLFDMGLAHEQFADVSGYGDYYHSLKRRRPDQPKKSRPRISDSRKRY